MGSGKCIHLLLFILVLGGILQAGDPGYIFNSRHLGTKEGLSNENILSMTQTSDGIMWIGTRYGLNRYDGYEFRWYTNESSGLKEDFIDKIVEDGFGRLWLMSTVKVSVNILFNSLVIFDPGSETSLTFEEAYPDFPLPKNLFKDIFQLPDRSLVISLTDGSYYRYEGGATFTKLPFRPHFQWLGSYDDGEVWGSYGHELVNLNLNGDILESYVINPDEEIFKLSTDPSGRIWMLSGKFESTEYFNLKIQVLMEGTLKSMLPSLEIKNPNRFRMLPRFSHGSMVIVSDKKLIEIDRDLNVNFELDYFISNPITFESCLFMDRQGTLWIGDRRGIHLIDFEASKFKTYLNKEDITIPTRGIAEYGSALLINSSRGGFWMDPATGNYTLYSDDPHFKKIKAFPAQLVEDNELWVASDGLHQLDGNGKVIKSYLPGEERRSKIWSFFKSSSGTWWLGMQPHIHFFNPAEHEDFQELTHLNGFSDLDEVLVWDFREDEYGIWIATIKGLFLIDEQKGVIAQYGNTQPEQYFLPANQFTFIWREKKDTYWLTTDDGGLVKMHYHGPDLPPEYERRTRASGLPSNELYAIYQDDYGKVWISSSNGIIQMDKASMEVVNVFYEEHGIAHNECNKLSYYQSPSGQIYFGGLNGVTSFHPKDFTSESIKDIPVIFSDIQVVEEDTVRRVLKQAIETKKVTLYPDDIYIVLKLSMQDYFYSDQIKYNYQIKGIDKYPTTIIGNILQIGKLPYGNHELVIQGITPNQQKSSQTLELTIEVIRPFYFQWWFIVLSVILIGISIWQYSSWRVQALENRQAYLEKVVTERTEKIRSDKIVIEKQAAKLLEMDKIKTRFFENISHELRTPLTLILGPIDSILSRRRLENKDFTLMKLIQQNAHSLLKLINELLDISSLDANNMKVENQPFALYAFAKRMISSFEGAAKLQGVNMHLEFSLNPHIQIVTDGEKLEKILNNFLSNALKFTYRDGRITLRFYRQGPLLYISVEDTGAGIVKEDLEKIFDRFYQSRDGSIRDHQLQGTGIGLAICKEMARLMGGDVWANSEIGKGSTFFVKIPLVETFEISESTERTTISSQAPDPVMRPVQSSIGSHSILLVEDHISMVQYIDTVLEDYKIIHAENGEVALNILEQQNFDLIISDIMMPEMDGITLLEKLKSDDQFRHIPVLMLTARQALDDKVHALRIGVDDYMTKPFQAEELLARVGNLIANNQTKKGSVSKDKPASNGLIVTEADVKWLAEVEHFIMDQVDDPELTIEGLARQFNLGIRRFQQKIKSITGLSPNKYVRQIKLESARRLLEDGICHSVSEVSYRIGFKDQYYFSQLYVKRYGRTPSSYF